MKHQTSGIRSLLLRLLLSFLLVFSLLGTVLGGIGTTVLVSPTQFLQQLEKQDAAQKVHDSLQSKFETLYNTTAVPSEIYMDVLTTEWLDQAMTAWIEDAYAVPDTVPTLDHTAVDEAIRIYFEQYAEENDYEIDDTYTEKLTEITEDAADTIQDAVDVYHIAVMQDAGIWEKLLQYAALLEKITVGCCIISLLLLMGLLLLRKQAAYWIGTSLFANGIILTIPAAYILGSGIIGQFALKEAAVYAVFTGLMETLTDWILGFGIAACVLGLLLWTGSMLRTKRVDSKETILEESLEESDENTKKENIEKA